MIMSLTYTKDAAEIIRNMLTKKLPFEIYQIANKGQCSWYEFTRVVFETLGMDASLSPTKTNVLTYILLRRNI
jgi:dTDP-4-dehydrorhamnose reductase